MDTTRGLQGLHRDNGHCMGSCKNFIISHEITGGVHEMTSGLHKTTGGHVGSSKIAGITGDLMGIG